MEASAAASGRVTESTALMSPARVRSSAGALPASAVPSALLDYLAPEVPGWHVLFGGQGYLSTRDGGQELTFWYERDPEPAEPAAAASQATYVPRHMAAVPSTGDAASPVAPAAAGAIGLGFAALGALLRRRRED